MAEFALEILTTKTQSFPKLGYWVATDKVEMVFGARWNQNCTPLNEREGISYRRVAPI
jgi:hypothetical protein